MKTVEIRKMSTEEITKKIEELKTQHKLKRHIELMK